MKRGTHSPVFWMLAAALWLAPAAWGQRRPHIGYVYPAGGQIGTTVQIKLGGQDLDELEGVTVTGSGITARVAEYQRRLNNQEVQLLRQQVAELKQQTAAAAKAAAAAKKEGKAPPASAPDPTTAELIAKIDRRLGEWVQQPACASISAIAYVEVTIDPEATLGPRELRLVTARGVSNPLPFHVGQFPEFVRKAMITATIQVLGKEASALRKRPPEEMEMRIFTPCTVNGQVASGEVNRYRFEATKGQRLVVSTLARQLIPFVADAVPGWFQPVMVLYNAQGREVAYADDYRFKPDPVILYEVPADGEYVFEIHDSLYRGREDFVYRITVGELPFVTSLFPLGASVGSRPVPGMSGWNLVDADLSLPPNTAGPGTLALFASRFGYQSNRVPFALDPLPDIFDREPNNTIASAEPISLPAAINGRIDRPDDLDVYSFTGKANDRVAIEVMARRLDSPLDSVIKLTDAKGKVIAFNDDQEDLMAGINTHHADSYLLAKLPADGTYFVHIGDTARHGGEEYAYRMRVSAPEPDFELRISPSSVNLTTNNTAVVNLFAVRKDGFTGAIKFTLQNPPAGISAAPVTLAGNQNVGRFAIRSGPRPTNGPIKLSVVGSARLGGKDVVHEAIAAEDRMQAFLWRHLVPASDFQALVYDRNYQPPPKRVPPARPAIVASAPVVAAKTTNSGPTTGGGGTTTAAAPKFTKQQIAGRLRQLKLLYEEGLLADEFYFARVAECETSQ